MFHISDLPEIPIRQMLFSPANVPEINMKPQRNTYLVSDVIFQRNEELQKFEIGPRDFRKFSINPEIMDVEVLKCLQKLIRMFAMNDILWEFGVTTSARVARGPVLQLMTPDPVHPADPVRVRNHCSI